MVKRQQDKQAAAEQQSEGMDVRTDASGRQLHPWEMSPEDHLTRGRNAQESQAEQDLAPEGDEAADDAAESGAQGEPARYDAP